MAAFCVTCAKEKRKPVGEGSNLHRKGMSSEVPNSDFRSRNGRNVFCREPGFPFHTHVQMWCSISPGAGARCLEVNLDPGKL